MTVPRPFGTRAAPGRAIAFGFTVALCALGMAPSRVAHAGGDADSLRFSGFAEASVQSSTASRDGAIVGSLYGRQQGQFSLDAFELGLDRPVAADRTMAGFTLRMIYGGSATSIHAAGLDVGPLADLTQAFVTLNHPTRSGAVQVSAGKLSSMLGLEVIESVLNPNLSAGNQFIFLEDFTHVGLDVNWIISPQWGARACITNGWDLAVDNNRAQSFMAHVAYTPDPSTSITCSGYAGPEQAENNHDARTGGELLVSRSLGASSFAVQADAGHEAGIDASWWGAGAWVTLGLGATNAVALRVDHVDDEDGARTSGLLGYPALTRQRLSSLTLTLNHQPAQGLLVRPEIRYDRSDRRVYNRDRAQLTLAVGAAYRY
jgi:hypothetical protein